MAHTASLVVAALSPSGQLCEQPSPLPFWVAFSIILNWALEYTLLKLALFSLFPVEKMGLRDVNQAARKQNSVCV